VTASTPKHPNASQPLTGRVTWALSPSVRLTPLPFGGQVLVELPTLTCHELLDEAARLLTLPVGTPVSLGAPEREFLTIAASAGWIVDVSYATDPVVALADRR